MDRVTTPVIFAMLASILLSCAPKDVQLGGLEERSWQVSANLYELLMNEEKRRLRESGQMVDLFEGGGAVDVFPPDTLPGIFDVCFNIPFPKEASLRFSPNDGELVVSHYPEQLDQLDEFIRSLGSMDRIMIDRKMFHPKGAMVINGGDDSEGLATRKWHCAKEVIEALIALRQELSSQSNPFVDPSDPPPPPPKLTLRQEFMRWGIAFPEGASIAYHPESEILTSVHHLTDAARVELLLLHAAFKLSEEQASN